MKNRINGIVFIIALAFLVESCATGEQHHQDIKHSYPVANSIEWGDHIVGFQKFSETDFSRPSFDTEVGYRKVDFGMWFPAKGQNTERIKFLDYLTLFDNKPGDSVATDYSRQKSFLGEVDPLVLKENLSIATSAFHGAEPLAESFPLVVYSGKANDVVYGNAVLFEYLASHGFVVLSVPPKVPKAENESMPLNNLNDIRFAINRIKQFSPSVDLSNMATIGYEIGGVSSAALTIGNLNIKAHVSLQGAVGSNFGWSFSESLFNNNLSDFKVPLLHFGSEAYEKEPKYIMGEATFETADSIYNAKRYFSFLENSVPLGVSSHLVMTWVHPLVEVKDEYRIDKEGINRGYENMLKQTLLFLNVYIKEDSNLVKLDELILSRHEKNFIRPASQLSYE